MEIRTRFAPSPTGYMHIGNLRTALYAYLIAKHSGGVFVLRIEDTDQQRLVEGAADVIFDTLKKTGLVHDEGPDVGGPYGPYVQSQRRGLYREYAERLIDAGGAYYCFCGHCEEDADGKPFEKRRDPCRNLDTAAARARVAAGESFVIRQKIPEGETSFSDVVYGVITVPNSDLDEGVLLKSDGLPTYNFANVVDDHLMKITHVVRGSEYLSSTPKYNILYDAFGWEKPVYIHCPPVMKDEHSKLSKRNGDASYQDLIAKGYLSEAVLNYIALLGWSPGGEREKFSLGELVEIFDVGGISKSPAIFDPEKLKWLNAEYIKALAPEQFAALAKPYIDRAVEREDIDRVRVAALLQQRCEILSDIPEKLDFFDALPDYDAVFYRHKKMKTDEQNSLESLEQILPCLERIGDWTEQNIHDALFALIERLGCKNGLILWPLRVAVSGKEVTPGGGIEIAALLGKEETLSRIKKGVALLKSL